VEYSPLRGPVDEATLRTGRAFKPTLTRANDVESTTAVELLGRYSNRDIATKLQRVLAGHGRDRLPDRTTRSAQRQRRLDNQERARLLAAYDHGVMINELAAMFGLSRTAVMANLRRLGAGSRRGIVDRRIEEATTLYAEGSSLAKLGDRYGVYPSTVRDALRKRGFPFVRAPVRSGPCQISAGEPLDAR
jgi:AraC-like DNA-binding protein